MTCVSFLCYSVDGMLSEFTKCDIHSCEGYTYRLYQVLLVTSVLEVRHQGLCKFIFHVFSIKHNQADVAVIWFGLCSLVLPLP